MRAPLMKRKPSPQYTADQVRLLLRDACDGNQARWCAQHGIPTPHVSDTLAGRRKPTPAILKALDLERREMYFPRG